MDRILVSGDVRVTAGYSSFLAGLELVDTGGRIRLRLKVSKDAPSAVENYDDVRIAASSPAGKKALENFNNYSVGDMSYEQVLAFYNLEPVQGFNLWQTWPFYWAASAIHWANYVLFGDREAVRNG